MLPPDSFESSRKRRLKHEQAQAASTSQQREDAVLLAYGEYRNKEIDKYIAANHEGYERSRLIKAEEARAKFDRMSEWKPELVDKFVTTLARAEMAKRISFDNLETFREHQQKLQPLLALPAPQQERGSDPPATAEDGYFVV
jgi:hypothetical protein